MADGSIGHRRQAPAKPPQPLRDFRLPVADEWRFMRGRKEPAMPSLASRAALALLAILSLHCTDVGHDKAEDAPFEFAEPAGGKADETGAVLGAEELARIEAALSDAIAAGDQTVASIEREIAKLESDHSRKEAEIASLIQQIEDRKRQIEREYDDKRTLCVLCVFFGCPNVCFVSLVGMMDDDASLRSLNSQLDDARRQQADLVAAGATYRARRDALRDELAVLRTVRAELMATLQGGQVIVPPELADHPEIARLATRVELLSQVLANSDEQVAVLGRIRGLAQELGDVMDSAIVTLRALASSADAAARASRKRTHDLIAMATGPSPDAAASAWLEDELARRTKKMIDALGWPTSEFVHFLVSERGEGDEAALEALARRLLEKMLGAVVIREGRTPGAAIGDHAAVSDTLVVLAPQRLVGLTLELDIRHSYVGDLVVTLTGPDGTVAVAHDRLGGSADDLRQAIPLRQFTGKSAQGAWTLEVRDTADGDVGTLVRWGLELALKPL
jgi:hypothetical protein